MISQVPVTKLVPYEKNAKKHPKKQVQQVANSIETFGFNQPIVVDQNNVVIVGHGRLEAAKLLGLKTVPVLKLDITEEQAKAYRLADNKLNESDWDMQLVVEELKGLSMPMLDLTGFDRDLVLESDDKDDEVPLIPEKAQSKLGDLFELGPHRLLCGDSLSVAAVEKLMDGRKADMVFTDPPYNVNYEGGGENTSNKIMNDKMTDAAFDTFLYEAFSRMKEVIKVSAGCYVFHSHKTMTAFEAALKRAGFTIDTQLIWNKPSAGMGMNDYRTKHEPFFYCYISKDKKSFYGDRSGTSVWKIPENPAKAFEWFLKETEAQEAGASSVWSMRRTNVQGYVHPTQKPVELVVKAITNSSKQEDIVLDLFLGSGSTLISAEKAGRTCYGMELDPQYVDVIVTRYLQYTNGTTVIKNGKEVKWKYDRKETN